MGSYSITQVANQLGIKVHTIRYWEKHVSLISVKRDEHGKRLYDRYDIYLLIRLKYYIEEKHFTLKGAAEELVNEMASSAQSQMGSPRKEILDIIKQLEMQNERLSEVKKKVEESRKQLKI